MKPFSEMGDAELGEALRAIRPKPSPAFAAELDQRVAAGFPRRSPQGEWSPLANFLGWFRGARWRLLIPAGGVAVVAIAVATVVLATGGSSGPSEGGALLGKINGEVTKVGGGGVEETSGPSGEAGSTSAEAAKEAAPSSSAGTGSSAGPSQAAGEAEAQPQHEAPALVPPEIVPAPAQGALGTSHRNVERGAEIVIGTKPGDVGEASSQVFETVHRYDGIVLNSSTQNGSGTQAEATFELLIPSGKIGDAMAAFSRIGEVVNRHETTNDITAPTVGASERLQDSEARIEGLLAQLAEATTESEREIVEAELDAERSHAAHLKSKLSNLHRRANLSRVSVRIVSGKGALTPGGSSSGDSWGIGKALGDAGHLLSVAAGVTIVGLAVLAPLLLLAFLVWLAGRAWTRRARDRALT